MLCEKCGKNNDVGIKNCSHCGADMPERSVCGGFGDILSFDVSAEKQNSDRNDSGVNVDGLKILSNQLYAAKKTVTRTMILSLIALCVATISLGFAIMLAVSEPKTVVAEEHPMLNEYDTQKETAVEVDDKPQNEVVEEMRESEETYFSGIVK